MPHQDVPDEKLALIAEKLIDVARDEFKFYTLEIRNRQTTIQNIYFWIAASLFSVYVAVFGGVFADKPIMHLELIPICPSLLHKIVIMLGFFMIIAIILTGIDNMRGRGFGDRNITGASTPLALYEAYLSAPELTKSEIVRHFLDQCAKNIDYNASECVRVGKHLRRTSYSLIISIVIGILAFII